MSNRFSGIKNLIWAFCIVICLVALFIGLIFVSVQEFYGDRGELTLSLGQNQPAAKPKAESMTVVTGLPSGVLNGLPSSSDGGQAYVDSLHFLCDSSLIGLRDYGVLSGGTGTTQVWSTDSGVIDASSLSGFMLIYPGDGSQISPANAAMIAQPSVLFISLGSDGLANIGEAEFVSGYKTLIQGIQTSSPVTRVVCCNLTPISSSYSAGDGLTNEKINEANGWIQQICTDCGVYYADIASVVTEDGALKDDFASANGKTLSSSGITQVLQYLRVHAIS